MTLVLAGHSSGGFEEGIYFASDSHITQNNHVLVKGFKKVIEIPIRVKGLNFCGEWFNGYSGNSYQGACSVAFAGSSLVAQHLINSMKNHLTELFPTYYNDSYQIVMSCETNKHLRQTDYDDSMFLDSHLDTILTAEYVSQVICHSIEAVLNKAREHCSMSRLFTAYQAEFILGVQCPQTREYHLYQYEIVPDQELGAKVEITRVNQNELAVIGAKKFKDDALIELAQCEGEEKPSEKIFRFLNSVIESETSIGNNGIGKPSGLYNLQGSILTRIGFER
ncbi:hypothetical protein PSEHALCIP103_01585 [Pseudoalteromonas haloplanktis]|uniref:Uncharacterized protein n=2 Tax=Pseudoalteromonas TaxID=53246 RepID=A0A9W4QX85_PSEHA|nr:MULTISPECIES: hypothetical protein [Pseudoalteromonas]MBD0411231.1 hypothetical protein [Pseudoalteromonas distincta]MBE0458530.1 hypothetical protein [Pseudoalteromonas prydzensis]MBH0091349.1 hypothetical protein [Pseudoalteromonas sp. SCQQ13]MBQ4832415.1 hypothetical protein [Pseudoalteromonas sp. MMG010]CAH9057080.1 hypothetical protein PSEHALCIP103_01585 [Pseudoalteromonas haloplanktis]